MSKWDWSSSTITAIREERERRRRRQGLSFFVSGAGGVRRSQWTHGHPVPTDGCRPSYSADFTCQVFPITTHVNPSVLLLQPMLSHPQSIRVQSDRSSWILIAVSSTRFHHLRVPLPCSYPHPVSRFSQRRWDARSQERRLSLYIPCDTRIDVFLLLETQGSFSHLQPRPTEWCAPSATPPLNCLSRRNLQCSSSTRLQLVVVERLLIQWFSQYGSLCFRHGGS